MAELLQVVESIRTEEQRTRAVFTSADGSRIRRMRTPQYLAVLAEAVTLVADVYAGKKNMHYLQEAMTTSDFPILFGDIIDRMLLAKYREIAPTYSAYVKVATVRDFREVSRKGINGGRGLMSKVGEKAGYPVRAYSEAEYKYAVEKYGARMDFSWEALVNDDLDALRDAPGDLAIAARRTEEYFATDLFVGATGPDTTFFSAGNGNVVTGNPALSVAGLQTAMQVLAAQKDSDGRPINITAAVLVVPPALAITAQNILNALQIEMTEAGGTAGQKIVAQNWMKNAVRLVVNYEIPNIATTNGNTSWFLFQDPNVGRPALEMGFLRGHVEPEIFMKEPNARRVGGGVVNPLDGDFDTDSVEYKVRHVLGGTTMDPKAAVASNGSGS
jgi:hypothetical protein